MAGETVVFHPRTGSLQTLVGMLCLYGIQGSLTLNKTGPLASHPSWKSATVKDKVIGFLLTIDRINHFFDDKGSNSTREQQIQSWCDSYALGQKLCNMRTSYSKHGYWNGQTICRGAIKGIWYGYKWLLDALCFDYPAPISTVQVHNECDEDVICGGDIPHYIEAVDETVADLGRDPVTGGHNI